MGVLEVLCGSTDGGVTFRECRDCGVTVADDGDECPTCGSEEIAHYAF
jgi:predicted Zn-ribbon and HTH transcriptional regulator